ncbi:sn-glycerol-3-phosphate ABC transporter ATP-binding protein UgpC [Alsobacter sp. SYSU M60028]|uniref:Sn-glycerol-3-phosphate ABC transporter ATP-binding protein UgpC n=1 Tax=Alsobacter ponti TaxID=2962936 RepID=A0ABT1LAN3_9HYPH|nr:sn-glycerol-3-phosphate ABC transporter ATP-binding protein UgpC [Alsobacter ponti]MCP8938552.1 sn-glycerol-3-phosphate ABC transporter ATP-binding protein UgpC [Alsobacter ponti]
MSTRDQRCEVSVRGVDIGFGRVKVLEKLNLDIAQSEFIVLLGPSGCGKSTLLNAIAGLLDVNDGQIWIGGRNVTWEEPKDRGIAMVFQSYALYPRMTVRGNMSFGLRVAGMPAAEIQKRVTEAAAMLKITNLLDRRPSELSGGQRQRVAIGRALVRDAGVFLFDEPLSNLDAQLRVELRVEIKRLHQRLSATMIYVTHDQIEALTLADRIAVMQGGVIQQLDTPQKVYREPINRFVASFVGSPSMNFVPGRIEGANGVLAFVGGDLTIPLQGYAFRSPAAPGPAVLGVRPEHVLAGGAAGPAAIQAPIEMIEPMGADSLVWCRMPSGASFSVRVDGEARVAPGGTLPVSFPATALSLFDDGPGERL